ncbi:MAG TPA: ABC transporter permease [Acidobacteriaceae bacterium]|jgi:predicted permease|nr:ABC transporter permease [Acidobacteriaceae bacterium]
MDVWLQDLRYAVRRLLQSPGFTAVAMLTLALGIGANTVLFSVVNGVLLNPLGYSHPGQLVAVYQSDSAMTRAPISYLNFLDWERGTQTFSSMGFYRHEDYNMTGRGQPERVNGLMITAGFFETLGVRPMLGRDFERGEDHLGAAPVTVVSEDFWRRKLDGSRAALGKGIDLNGTEYTVVGVMPPGFAFYGTNRDLYTLAGQWTDPSFRDRRVEESAHAVGRLKPGVTLEQAGADMDSVARRLAEAYPEADKALGITLVPMKEDIVGNVKPLLLVLLGAVGFLLLLACANVASLLLARSMRRSGELAIRAALGASRARLVRQLLTESVLLAGLGGALGLALAWLGTKAVMGLLPSALPRADQVSIDGRVLLFTLGVSLVGGIAFGMAPALTASRCDVQAVLRRGGRSVAGAGHRLQGMLVPLEIAAALVLLVGAGLMLRSLAALWKVNPGYDPNNAITFSLSLPSNAKTTAVETRARLRRLDAAMQAIPGVEAVSVTLGSRPMIHDSELHFWIEGRPKPANDNDMPMSLFYLVESGFRKAMGIRLERGRWVTAEDDEHAPLVVDIDDAFARTYFPHEDPIGQHIHMVDFGNEAEIVGVVGHVRQWGPGTDAKAAIEAQFFYPFMQLPPKLMQLVANGVAVVLRTRDDPAAVMGQVRSAVSDIDPGAVMYAGTTMQDVLEDSLAARRLAMMLLAAFAGFAVLMSCVGIYGVTAYLVSERTREIGVRMALGAQRGDVLRLVVGRGAAMALAGVVLGAAAALGLTQLMTSQLYGVSAHDPATFAAVGAGLLAVAVLACYFPALRATRIDPMVALRCE